jgi:dipeptidyl-peptidase-4
MIAELLSTNRPYCANAAMTPRQALLSAITGLFSCALAAQEAQKPTPAAPTSLPKLSCQVLLEQGASLVAPPSMVRWLPGGHDAAILLRDGEERIVRRSPGQAEPQPMCDARALCKALGLPVTDGKPVVLPDWSMLDATTLRFLLPGAVHTHKLGDEHSTRILQWPQDLDVRDDGASFSIAPGDQRVAYIRQNDLQVVGRDGNARRITWDGSSEIVYGGAAHRAEFGISGGLLWSSDGKRLAFYREDQRNISPYPYQDLNAMPPAQKLGRYPMAGFAASKVQVFVLDTETNALVSLESDLALDLYWTNLTFGADGKTICVALVTRGQDRMDLVRFDSVTGRRLGTLVSEQDPQWVEPEHGPSFLADGRFVWWSQRDGHRHLYLHDGNGALLLQITKGAFDVQELISCNADSTCLWFTASGEDPRQKHLFTAKLDGSEVKQLTRDRGTHLCTLAPDGKFAFEIWSNLETPPTPRFVDLATGISELLPQPPSPLLAYELPMQREFQEKAEDGTVLYGSVLLPHTIAEGQKLPVLLYVYGGPHVQQVTDQWLGGASLFLCALANEGYVVCRLDNRGTPNRGIEFEQSIHRHLGTLEVQDQMRAVYWLKQQPFVDATRIGVHGWSYGGYLTLRLMLLYPDTFACGISGAPVTDWAMYETGYGERYMDTPLENPQGYEAASCLPIADKLKNHLLLVHGTDDRTVMWSNSLAFVSRCIEHGVLLDYFPYPMQTHKLVGKDRLHFQQLLKDYLDRHLKGAK